MLLENSSKTRVFSLVARNKKTLTRIAYSWNSSSVWPFIIPIRKHNFFFFPAPPEKRKVLIKSLNSPACLALGTE